MEVLINTSLIAPLDGPAARFEIPLSAALVQLKVQPVVADVGV